MTSVVITMPAYRAAQTLARTVEDIPEGIASHLVLVDDASPDETVEVARALGLHVRVHPENRGYGGNQKTCYREALDLGGDIVVLLHPDYQYDPKAVPLLIAPILAGYADMTFGSRFAGLGDPRAGGMPLYRYLGNRLTTVLENLALGTHFTETHSGMRAYTRDCLLRMPLLGYSDDFWFDTQFLVDAVTSGMRVIEVPIPTRYTAESSSIGIGRSLRYVAASLAYAARMSAARGRKGRRNPVARRPRPSGGAEDLRIEVPGPLEHARIAEVAGAFMGGPSATLVTPPEREDPSVSLDAAVETAGLEGIIALLIDAGDRSGSHAAARVQRLLEARALRLIAWEGAGERFVALARAPGQG
ncbi:MAG: glycosyltransferase family 2 protein [Actinomycetota bacterium]